MPESPSAAGSAVLVTGASGFIASHTILHLLASGYCVRGTLRGSPRKLQLFYEQLAGDAARERLAFFTADLNAEAGWAEAVQGCRYVIHIAGCFPLFEPKRHEELIQPAVDGTLRLLQTAEQAGVKRLVLLSSTAAVMGGHEKVNKVFDENDWADLNADLDAYSRSKTMQEQAAWAFTQTNQDAPELVVINPPYIFGPLLDSHPVASGELIRVLMAAERPGVAPVTMPFSDVRDVAGILVRAMQDPEATGKRFICTGHILPMGEIARILAKHYRPLGRRIPTWIIPAAMIRFLAIFDPRIRLTLVGLGWRFENSTERARLTLGWQPRPAEETILEMAESMLQVGYVS